MSNQLSLGQVPSGTQEQQIHQYWTSTSHLWYCFKVPSQPEDIYGYAGFHIKIVLNKTILTVYIYKGYFAVFILTLDTEEEIKSNEISYHLTIIISEGVKLILGVKIKSG